LRRVGFSRQKVAASPKMTVGKNMQFYGVGYKLLDIYLVYTLFIKHAQANQGYLDIKFSILEQERLKETSPKFHIQSKHMIQETKQTATTLY
jgi:hypothetical protein